MSRKKDGSASVVVLSLVGKMMFRDQEKLQLLKRFRQSLDPDAPWVGFYCAGEIGPVEEHNLRHLYTSVVLALS